SSHQFVVIVILPQLSRLSYPRISIYFFFSSRRRHTRSKRDWSSDVCSSDLPGKTWEGAISGTLFAGISAILTAKYLLKLEEYSKIGRASCRERVWIWVVAG